jgi:mitotic spindle assembly checkpoint protein MAD2
MASTDTQTIITLSGSVAIVSEFFFTAINSILYQRGIYQPETFRRESKYGLTVLTTTDEGLLEYLNNVMEQMKNWLLDGNVQRLVVVVTGVDSGETLERWQFNVSVDDNEDKCHPSARISGSDENHDPTSTQMNVEHDDKKNVVQQGGSQVKKKQKSLKEIHNEIQAIIRQITASVSLYGMHKTIYYVCQFDVYIHVSHPLFFNRSHFYHC